MEKCRWLYVFIAMVSSPLMAQLLLPILCPPFFIDDPQRGHQVPHHKKMIRSQYFRRRDLKKVKWAGDDGDDDDDDDGRFYHCLLRVYDDDRQ